MLFDVITVLLIFDIKSLKVELSILLYLDDILFCVPVCGVQHKKDLQAAMYRLCIFGYFSGPRVNLSKMYAVVKRQGEEAPMPKVVVGCAVKPFVRYWGILLGNISVEQAYAPSISRMMQRARQMAALPLGLEEKAHLFSSWIAPMCYLPARAYRPTDHVLSQLNLVHKIALGLNNWHLTMPILQLPVKEGMLAQANLAAYAEWVHTQSFVRFVRRPAQFAERHVTPFRRWAFSVGLLIEEEFLPFLQMALVPLPRPSFLQGSLKSYSVVRGRKSRRPRSSVYSTCRFGITPSYVIFARSPTRLPR